MNAYTRIAARLPETVKDLARSRPFFGTAEPQPRSYRDRLAARERVRPDGTPVWPIRVSDLPSSFGERCVGKGRG